MAADRLHAGQDRASIPEPGQTIGGKYVVEGVLGEGGMGVVLGARHEALGQAVAIKLLLPRTLAIPGAVARFLREARTAAALRSEHVARVVDVGTLDSGAPYMVMERLVGSDLGDVLAARGPIPAAEAVDYVLQACDAIAEAHALGIVHRDLKPSNLFLMRRPNGMPLVKVLDFGISKVDQGPLAGADAGKLTATGAVMGSPVYMSPEQVRSSRSVDARSDIWSLGVILHELVSRRHPFEAETLPGIMAAIAADPPAPLREHRPDVPPELEAIVGRCLEKDVARRVPDVVTLVAALRELAPTSLQQVPRQTVPAPAARLPRAVDVDDTTLAAPTVSATGAGGGTSTARSARGHRAVVGAGLALVMVLLVACGAALARFVDGHAHAASPVAAPGYAAPTAPLSAPPPFSSNDVAAAPSSSASANPVQGSAAPAPATAGAAGPAEAPRRGAPPAPRRAPSPPDPRTAHVDAPPPKPPARDPLVDR